MERDVKDYPFFCLSLHSRALDTLALTFFPPLVSMTSEDTAMTFPKTAGTAPVLKISPAEVESRKIRLIARILRQGSIIAFPTDTFYGLGADCFSGPALQRIYQIKKRQPLKPMPVLISDINQVSILAAEIPPVFDRLADALWPGPLTLILKAARGLPSILTGQKQTIGIRLPAVSWLRELVRQTGSPVVATSANISGETEIDSAEDVVRQFQRKVDLIVDGGRTPGGRPSTVVDVSLDKPVIVRAGAIPEAEINKILSP
jgi:L-threonylcarbamoyladenylate synthase